MPRAATRLLLVLAAILAAPMAQAQDLVIGDWLSPKGDAKMRITHCGDSVCGTFLWFKDPLDPDTGKPPLDEHNPDKALRSRPLLGMTFVEGFKPGHDGRWVHGRIYDPSTGHFWASRLVPTAAGDLKMEGCIGPICAGQTWTPAGGASEFTAR